MTLKIRCSPEANARSHDVFPRDEETAWNLPARGKKVKSPFSSNLKPENTDELFPKSALRPQPLISYHKRISLSHFKRKELPLINFPSLLFPSICLP